MTGNKFEGNKIGIVTPMRNEISNLPELFTAVEALDQPPVIWVIVENGSTDGSYEYALARKRGLKRIQVFEILVKNDENGQYELGSKYSRIVDFGLKRVRSIEEEKDISLSFYGILDADCFPEPMYYTRLCEAFSILPRLGIASGDIYIRENDGMLRKECRPERWARGGIRLMRRACYEDAGYVTGMSADALTAAKAWSAGWQSQSFGFCKVISRQVCARVDNSYIGRAAYYRYIPFYMIIIKAIWYLLGSRPHEAKSYMRGYWAARQERSRGEVPSEVKKYFKLLPFRIILENLYVWRNKCLLKKR